RARACHRHRRPGMAPAPAQAAGRAQRASGGSLLPRGLLQTTATDCSGVAAECWRRDNDVKRASRSTFGRPDTRLMNAKRIENMSRSLQICSPIYPMSRDDSALAARSVLQDNTLLRRAWPEAPAHRLEFPGEV